MPLHELQTDADGGESGATSEAAPAADSEDEDYEREAAARGQKRPRPLRGGGAGGRRFGRHARADAVKVRHRGLTLTPTRSLPYPNCEINSITSMHNNLAAS